MLWSLMGSNVLQGCKGVAVSPVSATFDFYDFGQTTLSLKPQFLYVWKENQPW